MDRFYLYAKNFMKKINNKLFKKVLGKFATGITVVSINNKGDKIGKTVNSFTALSLSPPLVLFSLDKKSSSLIKYKKSKLFGINILTKKQANISINFAKKNARWDNIPYFTSNLDTPFINNCVGNIECMNLKSFIEGDHVLFICKVLNASFKNKTKPLLYFDSQYL